MANCQIIRAQVNVVETGHALSLHKQGILYQYQFNIDRLF